MMSICSPAILACAIYCGSSSQSCMSRFTVTPGFSASKFAIICSQPSTMDSNLIVLLTILISIFSDPAAVPDALFVSPLQPASKVSTSITHVIRAALFFNMFTPPLL